MRRLVPAAAATTGKACACLFLAVLFLTAVVGSGWATFCIEADGSACCGRCLRCLCAGIDPGTHQPPAANAAQKDRDSSGDIPREGGACVDIPILGPFDASVSKDIPPLEPFPDCLVLSEPSSSLDGVFARSVREYSTERYFAPDQKLTLLASVVLII